MRYLPLSDPSVYAVLSRLIMFGDKGINKTNLSFLFAENKHVNILFSTETVFKLFVFMTKKSKTNNCMLILNYIRT